MSDAVALAETPAVALKEPVPLVQPLCEGLPENEGVALAEAERGALPQALKLTLLETVEVTLDEVLRLCEGDPVKETEGHAEAVKQPLVEAVAQMDGGALAEKLPLGVPLGHSELLPKGLLVPLPLPVGVVHAVAEAVTQCEGEALPDALLQGGGESEAAAEEEGCDAEALALPEVESEGARVAVPQFVAVPLDVGALVGEGSDEKEAHDEVDADSEGDPVVDRDGLPDWEVEELPLAPPLRVTETLGVLQGVGAGVALSRADAETLLLGTPVLLKRGLGDARPLAVAETHKLAEDVGVTVDCPVPLPLKEGGAVAVSCPDKVEAAEGVGESVAGGEGDALTLKFPDGEAAAVPLALSDPARDEVASIEGVPASLAVAMELAVLTLLREKDGGLVTEFVEDATAVADGEALNDALPESEAEKEGDPEPLAEAPAVPLCSALKLGSGDEVGGALGDANGEAVALPVVLPLKEACDEVPEGVLGGEEEGVMVELRHEEVLQEAVVDAVELRHREGLVVRESCADIEREGLAVGDPVNSGAFSRKPK